MQAKYFRQQFFSVLSHSLGSLLQASKRESTKKNSDLIKKILHSLFVLLPPK